MVTVKNGFCRSEIMHLPQCTVRLVMLMLCNYYIHRGVYASRVFLKAFPRIKGFQENRSVVVRFKFGLV